MTLLTEETALFVAPHSIVRRIWGRSDTILLVFAGAAAEFALNKAVDWLYFTGRLPADPLGRLFSTVSYTRGIVFADRATAHRTIDAIAAIHTQVEAQRNARIPDWAYRDVLFMLIDYSIRAYGLLEQPLQPAERREVFDVFFRVGTRMGLSALPTTYEAWTIERREHLRHNLRNSPHTRDLHRRYRAHIGWLRYRLLREAQKLLVPARVRQLLGLGRSSLLRPLLVLYRWSRRARLDGWIQGLLLPAGVRKKVAAMNKV